MGSPPSTVLRVFSMDDVVQAHVHAVHHPSQTEDGESPSLPGAPPPLLAGVRTGGEAAAFACGFWRGFGGTVVLWAPWGPGVDAASAP